MRKNNKKIVLHAHNFGHKNIGDDAMAVNVYRKLAKSSDIDLITVSTYSPPDGHEKDISSLSRVVNNYNNPVVKLFLVASHRLKLKFLYVFYVFFLCELIMLSAKVYKKYNVMLPIGRDISKFVRTVSNASVYLRSGSGSLNDIWFWSSMYPQYTEARICKVFSVKTYFTGQGIGPLSGVFRRKVLCDLLGICELLTFRDYKVSEEIVKTSCLKHANYRVVGDDAFDLKPENGFEKKLGEEVLIVCQFRPTDYEKSIHDDFWRDVALELDKISSKIPRCKIMLMSFSNGRIKDSSVARKISEISSSNLSVCEQVLSPEKAKNIIAQADFAIGQSYHFGVFAMSEGVPFVGLYTNKYYELKHTGLLGWYGMEDFAISDKHIDELAERVINAFADKILLENIYNVNNKMQKDIDDVFDSIL